MKTLLLIVILILVGVFFYFSISHIGAMNRGQQTGIISAVEKNGLVWKTWSAYVKTDPQSSQEDKYCVTDRSVVEELKEASQNRAMVTVHYSLPLIVFKWQCKGEGSIIRSVVGK